MTYLNLILGISQVGTLASLAFQLRCFFKYSHEVQNEMVGEMRLGTRCEFKKLELEMAKKVRLRKRIILTLVIASVLLVSGIFVFHVYYWHYKFNELNLCTYSLLYANSVLTKLYDIYSVMRVIVSGLIDILIAIMTCITLSVLNK